MKPTALRLAPLALAAFSALLVLPQEGQDEREAPQVATVGEAAPLFRLNDHTGEAVTIGGENELWTVVAFYPKAMTPG